MDKWTLNKEDYKGLITSVMMHFTSSYEDDDMSLGKSESSWEECGNIAFSCYVKVPKLDEPFTLILRSDESVTVYDNCTFNSTNFLNNKGMETVPRYHNNEVSIKFERNKEFKLSEYRDSIIDELI